MTNENALAARRVADARNLFGTADRDVRDCRRLDAAAADVRRDQRLDRRRRLLEKRDTDIVRPRRHGDARLKRTATAAAPALALIAGRRLTPFLLEQLRPRAVDGELELEAFTGRARIVDTAARVERQLLEVHVLRQLAGQLIGVDHPRHGEITDRQTADLASGADIPL